MLFPTILLKQPRYIDHVNCAPLLSKSTLRLWDYIVDNVLKKTSKHDPGQDFACHRKKRYATVIVRANPIFFALDYC